MNYITKATEWAEQGGPTPREYDDFNEWLAAIAKEVEDGNLDESGINNLRFAFGEALSTSTLQGISLHKPRAYAGDFEVIDRVYQRSMTTNPQLLNWDHYLLNTKAAQAVRNRKDYFLKLVDKLESDLPADEEVTILNIASGPSRDVFEYLSQTTDQRIDFDCVEYDQLAIKYATALCFEHLDRVNFLQKNAFRFTTKKRYPLIWSAGLFDYFDDRQFQFLTSRLLNFLEPGGELVIGNFSDDNPDRAYMELLMEWELNHRSAEHLTKLAMGCGVDESKIFVGKEPTGVNLFLHIKK